MSKVIMFSRVFPSYHPRKGEPTYFVEKFMKSIGIINGDEDRAFDPRLSLDDFAPKYHTIRAGYRFKKGDYFSPRVWSGKPYRSKQIILCPDVEVKSTWIIDVRFENGYHRIYLNGHIFIVARINPLHNFGFDVIDRDDGLYNLSKNDGLDEEDLLYWFNKPLSGRIICWNENINY